MEILGSAAPTLPTSQYVTRIKDENIAHDVSPLKFASTTTNLYSIRIHIMAATKENPIIFYDIPSEHGIWSPNTYKTRLTLNYKRLPYRVEYISYPDIEPKLKELGVRPTNPTPLFSYTLPMIADPSSDPHGKPTYVVESFDIAVYLDKTYPAPKYPAVFPEGTRAVQKITSDLYTNQVGYTLLPAARHFMSRPDYLNERDHEYFLRSREPVLKQIPADTTVGSKYWGSVYEKWNWFGEILDLNEEGPFVTGKQISFTDFAIGGIIFFVRRLEGPYGEMKMWNEMAQWQGGRWARLWAEIEKLEKDSTEVA